MKKNYILLVVFAFSCLTISYAISQEPKLKVDGKLHLYTNPSAPQLRLEGTHSYVELWGGYDFLIRNEGGSDLVKVAGNTGNVGIGTTNPQHKLQVQGNVKIAGSGNALKFPDGSEQTTAADLNTLFYRTSTTSGLVASGGVAEQIAACDYGDMIVSGGWEGYQNDNLAVSSSSRAYYSKPVSVDLYTGGWKVGFKNGTSEYYRLTVFAVCARVG